MKAYAVMFAWLLVAWVVVTVCCVTLAFALGNSSAGLRVPPAGEVLAGVALLAAGGLGAGRGARWIQGPGAKRRLILGATAGLLAPVLGLAMLLAALIPLEISLDLSFGETMPADHWLVLCLFGISVAIAVTVALAAGRKARRT